MKYIIIFTNGYTDDVESLTKELKCDVLIHDKKGNYYNPQFITIDRIKGEFNTGNVCYLEDNLVILHRITKENIIKSIQDLHNWFFYMRWYPLPPSQLEKYFPLKDNWVSIEVSV